MNHPAAKAFANAVESLQRVAEMCGGHSDPEVKNELVEELDDALRDIAKGVFILDISPTQPGLTVDVMPVIIQLKLMDRGIQLSKGRKPS